MVLLTFQTSVEKVHNDAFCESMTASKSFCLLARNSHFSNEVTPLRLFPNSLRGFLRRLKKQHNNAFAFEWVGEISLVLRFQTDVWSGSINAVRAVAGQCVQLLPFSAARGSQSGCCGRPVTPPPRSRVSVSCTCFTRREACSFLLRASLCTWPKWLSVSGCSRSTVQVWVPFRVSIDWIFQRKVTGKCHLKKSHEF